MKSDKRSFPCMTLAVLGFIVLCLLQPAAVTHGQGFDTLTVQAEDSIHLRMPPQAKLEAVRADPAFRYGRYIPLPQTAWDRFVAWLQEQIRNMLGNSAVNKAFDYLYYAIIFFMIVMVTAFMLKIRVRGLIGSDTLVSEGEVIVPGFPDADVQQLMQEALTAGRYGDALRCRYLMLLQQYAEGGVILNIGTWTSSQIALVIEDAAERRRFREVSNAFESVWYGGKPFGKDQYDALEINRAQKAVSRPSEA